MRFEHWETRLGAIVEMYARRPFEWGRYDCVLFAADCTWALTQKDPAAPWRGAYSDEAGAARLIAEAGGLSRLVETALSGIGLVCDRVKPAFAQRGDPVLFEAPGMLGSAGPALGVTLGEQFAAKGLDGIELRPMSAATMAWAIR